MDTSTDNLVDSLLLGGGGGATFLSPLPRGPLADAHLLCVELLLELSPPGSEEVFLDSSDRNGKDGDWDGHVALSSLIGVTWSSLFPGSTQGGGSLLFMADLVCDVLGRVGGGSLVVSWMLGESLNDLLEAGGVDVSALLCGFGSVAGGKLLA